MINRLGNMADRCGAAWLGARSGAKRFREDERGGIEKIVAIAIVVLITTTALAAVTLVVQDWVDNVPEPDGGGEFTVN